MFKWDKPLSDMSVGEVMESTIESGDFTFTMRVERHPARLGWGSLHVGPDEARVGDAEVAATEDDGEKPSD